jgi:hypothetical protein
MLNTKELTVEQTTQMIEQLDTIADTLFLAGQNTLGNAVQEVVYCLDAQIAEMLEQ